MNDNFAPNIHFGNINEVCSSTLAGAAWKGYSYNMPVEQSTDALWFVAIYLPVTYKVSYPLILYLLRFILFASACIFLLV